MSFVKKTFMAVVLFAGTLGAHEFGKVERCKEDPLSEMWQITGRNAWARKCKYIKPRLEAAFNEEGTYVIFTTGKFNGTPNIPVSEKAPCISGLAKMGSCVKAGCYTSDQLLMFNGELDSIERAYERRLETVTALDSRSVSFGLLFGEQQIEAYVSGETEELIYKLVTENNKTLKVTGNHPLVIENGQMVKAEKLREGDKLLSVEGLGVKVISVESNPFVGKVWNVMPKSVERIENIVIADGILTGSIRFQNEWANDAFRLSLRDEMDPSILEK